MKKILSIIGIGLLMASCKGDYKDWAEPQSNPDEGSKSVAFTAAPAAAIDFATAEGDSVVLFVPAVAIDDNATTTYNVFIETDKGSAGILADSQGRVSLDDLKAAIQETYGKGPEIHDNVKLAITAFTNINGQVIKNVSETTASVKLNPRAVSKEGYKLILSNGEEYDFTQMGEGSVYDNPNFRATFEAGDETTWTIKDIENGTVFGTEENGVDGNGNPVGKLAAGGEPGAVPYYTKWFLNINMEEYSFNLEQAPEFEEYIWQAGNANGWGSPAEPLYSAGGSGEYYGYMYLDGGFKFRSHEASWDAPDWGSDGTESGLQEFGQDLSAEAGFYRVEVSLVSMNYSITPVTSITVIGTAVGGWDEDHEVELTLNKSNGAWEGMVALAADEMKFRANHDWAWNWGGTELTNLKQDGLNYKVPEAGTYFIRLFARCDGKAYAEMTKQ